MIKEPVHIDFINQLPIIVSGVHSRTFCFYESPEVICRRLPGQNLNWAVSYDVPAALHIAEVVDMGVSIFKQPKSIP